MRQIFVFIDGTGCTLDTRTNIGAAHALVSETDLHRRYYQDGVAAYSRAKWIDIPLGQSVDRHVIDAYRALLLLNLSREDRLYIFGYSRGAVIARRLAMCLSSKEYLIAISSPGLNFEKSVQAEVAYLCLFDPVIGWPRLVGARFSDHDAIMEPKIKSYVELIALDEGRRMFPSDSYFASADTRRKIESFSSISSFDTTEDRAASYIELLVAKTRKSIWFPGTHADVGGHGKNKKIGDHALATALEEFFCAFGEHDDKSFLNLAEIGSLFRACRERSEEIYKPNGLIRRALKWVFGSKLMRSPKNRVVVQNIIHPLCLMTGDPKRFDGYPQYPDYSAMS